MGKRVALLSDSYKLEKMLPSSVDPLVSLMMVEKVPDSTYDMIGGLDQQIKEIKEVIELGLKHPELFESLGIEQPKEFFYTGLPEPGKRSLLEQWLIIRTAGSSGLVDLSWFRSISVRAVGWSVNCS